MNPLSETQPIYIMDANQNDSSKQQLPPHQSSKAHDFYDFFGSGNNHQIEANLKRIASNPDLDKKDLALLVLMLRNIPQPHIRRLVQNLPTVSSALQHILETVTNNESRSGARPWQDDVNEIEKLVYGPPLSPDIA